MRWLVALLLLTSSALAEPPAQPCPSISAGWTIPFSGPITSVGYDQTAQMLDVAFGPVMTTFVNVPLGVMQGFQNTSNANALVYYNSIVVPSYHALFLFQQNNCPMTLESGGYLWTD
jgi:hypothetical protein